MSILSAKDLSKAYGDDTIFSGVSLDIPRSARIALVGPNGAGKTTLMNILMGHDVPTSGDVTRMSNLTIGFLTQRPELLGKHTLWEEAIGAFDDVREMEVKLTRLEEAMANGDESAISKYGHLQEAFEQGGGYTYEAQTRTVLRGLGFMPDEFHTKLAQLSGGQKTRAVLARLLLESPDLLALDEPTNHLDIAAVEWLESHLKDFDGAVLAISHDRYFIDSYASTVWEMNFGRLETYRADYTGYLRQREERRERMQKEYEAQQAFIQKEEEYIQRNIAGQNTRQAQGRRKRLERLKQDNLIHSPDADRDKMRVELEIRHRGNEIVLKTSGLEVGYDGLPLLQVDDLRLDRGEIAALIGPNGVGKSTVIKTLLGQLPPIAGHAEIGDKVEVGYFAQAHELLNEANTVIDEIISVHRMTPGEARGYLARFLFRGDDVFRKIGALSGGERGRVALAKLALGTANLLLLDEPTNHLDIPSQEVLEDMLADYNGTVLLVSHDRYLIDALATQIWAATPPPEDELVGRVEVVRGSYKRYIEKREAERMAAAEAEAAAQQAVSSNGNGRKPQDKSEPQRPSHGLNPYQLDKRVTELERDIERMETRLEELTSELQTASATGNAALVKKLGDEYAQLQTDLETAIDEWGALAVE